jgi:Uma2 family endonuclease
MVDTPERLPAGPLTYRDYAELPEDGRRYEILDGELDVSPSPMIRHQMVIANLFSALRQHVQAHSLGTILLSPVDLILADTTVVVPDLMFVSHRRAPIITARAVEGPADLVVEIISPSTGRKDRLTKAALYARFGIPCYWLIDPEQRLFDAFVLGGGVYRLATRGQHDETVQTEPFVDLVIALSTIWA